MWCFFFLATIALATITASIAQIALGVGILVIYMIAMGILATEFPHPRGNDRTDDLWPVLLVLCAIAIVLLQYARRRTWQGRAIVAGFLMATAVLEFTLPDNAETAVARDYPTR